MPTRRPAPAPGRTDRPKPLPGGRASEPRNRAREPVERGCHAQPITGAVWQGGNHLGVGPDAVRRGRVGWNRFNGVGGFTDGETV